MEQTQKRRGDSRMKVMWRLSWPAIIEQILATMVSYVDTAMVGVMGAAGTAAVSVNAAPIWLSGGLLVGVGVGVSCTSLVVSDLGSTYQMSFSFSIITEKRYFTGSWAFCLSILATTVTVREESLAEPVIFPPHSPAERGWPG